LIAATVLSIFCTSSCRCASRSVVHSLNVGMFFAIPLFEPHLVALELDDPRLELLDE
jgi:hypothetical protein